MKLLALIEKLDLDDTPFQENLLGVLVETRCEAVCPEHLLAALLLIPDGYCAGRARKMKADPNNIAAVLKGCVENLDRQTPPATQLADARESAATAALCEAALSWLAESGHAEATQREFLSAILTEISDATADAVVEFAFLDWEAFCADLCWPPPPPVEAVSIWDNRTGRLRTEEAFDASGRKLISAVTAETMGLGLREYSTEALLTALLTIEPSVMDRAVRAQAGLAGGVGSGSELVREIRDRIRRPRNVREAPPLIRETCRDRLVMVFDAAAEISAAERRRKVSAGDVALALARTEAGGYLGGVLRSFGVDLKQAADFIASETQEPEAGEEAEGVSIHRLGETIRASIIGQDHAVKRVLPLLKRLRFGYRRPGKPAGVFMFMGPSGTGKTETAKVLARILYGSADAMIMLEMGQFGTKESKSLFIGAPPGYVGYGEGKLTNGLRDKPESVVLFDEVEKADPLVLDVLLRFLDEGKIDDPAGPVRDGSKCVIVLTSNFLADSLSRFENRLTAADAETEETLYRELRKELLNQGRTGIDEKIRKFFRPEFIFRIDEIILFRSFHSDDYRKIAEISLGAEIEYIRKRFDYMVTYDPEILDVIAAACEVRKDEGARVVNRLINVHAVNPLIDFFTEETTRGVEAVHLSFDSETNRIRIQDASGRVKAP